VMTPSGEPLRGAELHKRAALMGSPHDLIKIVR
jgi:hypothetical protein